MVSQAAKRELDSHQLARTVHHFVAVGRAAEAVRLLIEHDRYLDAGKLVLRVLGVGPAQVAGLEGKQRQYAHKAGLYLAHGGDLDGAITILEALGDQGAALKLRARLRPRSQRPRQDTSSQIDVARGLRQQSKCEEALAVLLGMATTQPDYTDACVLAIELAYELNLLDFELDAFVAEFARRPPATKQHVRALYLLGRLYEENEYANNAAAIYSRVEEASPGFRDAADRVAKLVRTSGSTSTVPNRESLDGVPLPSVAAPDSTPDEGAAGAARTKALGELARGAKITDRYRVIDRIGTGGMATVYEVQDLVLYVPVALKLFHLSPDDAQVSHERFKRELTIARQLTHPNVVRVYDIGEYDGHRFMTMEKLLGETVATTIDRKGFELAEAVYVLVQACHGLHAAHAQGVVHRDVKPDNLFVTTDGTVKVMDFGLAKQLSGRVSRRITIRGTTAGSPAYMSPDSVHGFSSATPAADIYSLGVVAYEMIGRAVPFYHQDPTSCMFMHVTEPVPALRDKVPNIPPELEALVLEMLAKKPEGRPKSCEEIAWRLMDVAAGL